LSCEVTAHVAEGNCVAARRGGEQPEANEQRPSKRLASVSSFVRHISGADLAAAHSRIRWSGQTALPFTNQLDGSCPPLEAVQSGAFLVTPRFCQPDPRDFAAGRRDGPSSADRDQVAWASCGRPSPQNPPVGHPESLFSPKRTAKPRGRTIANALILRVFF
jgi:hypothetical protein